MAAASQNTANFAWGFPSPGPQSPSGQDVMDHIFFLSKEQWKQARETNQYDIVIVGSGFCAFSIAHQALTNNESTRILILERGPFFLPEHFQNLPLPFEATLGGLSETFPWTVESKTFQKKRGDIIGTHGMVPFFGGRSTLWSAWCPEPTDEEFAGWPAETICAARANFAAAKAMLEVQQSNSVQLIHQKKPVFGKLQEKVAEKLHNASNTEGFKKMFTRWTHAPLASRSNSEDFTKFSVVGPMLKLAQKHKRNLHIVCNCIVELIIEQEGEATALRTSQGILPLGKAKLILANGTVPAATLARNSFPRTHGLGQTFSAHSISAITCRIPQKVFAKKLASLEFGAFYLAGIAGDHNHQYHIQLTVLHNSDPTDNADKALRYMPDVVATASAEQMKGSEGYVIFVCAVLGELEMPSTASCATASSSSQSSSSHEPSKVLVNESDPDCTTNSLLRIVSNDSDSLLTWEQMERATFFLLEQIFDQASGQVEYWKTDPGRWESSRPDQSQIRVPVTVHESSTLIIGKDVDLDYKLRGTQNVFVTGGALWPRSGSWNPTLTMCALAMDLVNRHFPAGCLRLPGLNAREIVDVLDTADGVHLVIKNKDSVIVWANDSFAQLVGSSKAELIGVKDTRAEHVADDQRVMKAGLPLSNYHETIAIPTSSDSTTSIPIVTQKGLRRDGADVTGITVCFSFEYPSFGIRDGHHVVVPSDEPEHSAQYWIDLLQLVPIPIGGHFGSKGVSLEMLAQQSLPERYEGSHPLYSSNAFLLQSGEVLQLHSLCQDELWFHHTGQQIRLHIFDLTRAQYHSVTLGQNRGAQIQTVAPHGTWFGAEVVGEGYGLVGCALAPGFEPQDSAKPSCDQVAILKSCFSDHSMIIDRLLGGHSAPQSSSS